eukprot:CAMPEP_0113549126 /NCGR_PEP_ID=MMETSP0015_2-20120614/13265_1 /TAXON_ID=2838 /ORGANISM="Odontella" /LENGTH=130 /DNA_ID=CAMNT_0000449811 /DNA_START=393 /DNA_END=785 /DNA_ORIENTATION=+ /assembly_acc=CAM_ASM_000160
MANVDISNAFIQVDMDELVHVNFKGFMAEMLAKIDPDCYTQYVRTERGKPVTYATLAKALYGILRASLLFWWKLLAKLIIWGHKINPYDWCVANKDVWRQQCTVLWHVDNMKLSHVSDEVLDQQILLIED